MNIDFDLVFYILVATSGVLIVFLLFTSIYYLIFWSVSAKKTPEVPHSNKKTNFAILIAARNESKVISNLLDSLLIQTYPRKYYEVYVIVESEDDPTVKIATEKGFKYFVRDRLEDDRRTKGFALQECIDYLWRNNLNYDAYMIFDADNVVDPNFIEVMNDLRQTGVQVGIGYRNFTNANTNHLTVGCSVMFSYMNQITSKGRSFLFHKATLMGTGYYVDTDIIKEAGGWIFTGMTEDIQLTTYCYYHDIYMSYYPLVCFYDEQSPDRKTVHNQQVRWLAGYFQSRKFLKKYGVQRDYHTKSLQKFMIYEFRAGLIPFIIFNIVSFVIVALGIVFGILSAIYGQDYQTGIIFTVAGFQFSVLYMSFVVAAMLSIIRNREYLRLTPKNTVIGLLGYMPFFYGFVTAYFDLVLHPKKGSTWTVTKHTGEISNKDISKDGK